MRDDIYTPANRIGPNRNLITPMFIPSPASYCLTGVQLRRIWGRGTNIVVLILYTNAVS